MAEPYRGILGPILGQVEAIKSARSNRAMDELQAKYLESNFQTQQEHRAQQTQAAALQAARDRTINRMSAAVQSGRALEAAPRLLGDPQTQEALKLLGVDGTAYLNTQGMSEPDAIANLQENIRALGGEIQGPEAYTLGPGQVRMEGGQQVAAAPFAPEKPPVPTDDMREYAQAKAQGFPGSFLDYQTQIRRAGATSIDMTQKTPPPPQGMVYVPDPDPNNRLGYRLEPIPGARDPRTEGQHKSALLSTRMRELSPDINDEAPSITTQTMANIAQSGGITGGLANVTLSARDQKHFNAARGWLAGVLRGDTGATIQPFEIQEYYPTFFPVPGDSKEVIEQKRKLRQVTEAAMTSNAGAVVGSGSPGTSPPQTGGATGGWQIEVVED